MITTTTVGPGSLNIGEPSDLGAFSEQATSCKLTPKVDQGDAIRVLSGGQVPGDRTETYTLDGSLLQDLSADDSTTIWLWKHRGQVLPFTFVPNSAAQVTISGDIQVEAIEIGGDAGTKPASEFSFSVTNPVLTEGPQ